LGGLKFAGSVDGLGGGAAFGLANFQWRFLSNSAKFGWGPIWEAFHFRGSGEFAPSHLLLFPFNVPNWLMYGASKKNQEENGCFVWLVAAPIRIFPLFLMLFDNSIIPNFTLLFILHYWAKYC
jgi:hypothetical protein